MASGKLEPLTIYGGHSVKELSSHVVEKVLSLHSISVLLPDCWC
jgi:hypothetical protein